MFVYTSTRLPVARIHVGGELDTCTEWLNVGWMRLNRELPSLNQRAPRVRDVTTLQTAIPRFTISYSNILSLLPLQSRKLQKKNPTVTSIIPRSPGRLVSESTKKLGSQCVEIWIQTMNVISMITVVNPLSIPPALYRRSSGTSPRSI